MPAPEARETGHDLAARILTETRSELARADGKAQILLATTGVVVGVVLATLIRGEWTPGELNGPGVWLWWVGVAALTTGVIALAVAVFPQLLAAADGNRVTYFEDVIRFKRNEADKLLSALNVEAERSDRDVEQLLRLSYVVHVKYRAIQVAMVTLGSAIVLCGIGAVVGSH